VEDINYRPTQIALLLPLESQNKNTNVLADNLKNAARLAAHDLKHLNLVLTIYPTSGEPTRAAYAAKAAVENGNQIIVGPLLSEETLAVKIALKKDLIKIISLSNDPSVAGNGVFIMGTTFQSVAKRLVTFSQSKGLKRIAIVSPKGPIGINGIEAAKDAIIGNGSNLSMIATYPLNVSDISELSPKIYEDLINSNTDAIIFTDSPTRGLGFITEQISTLF
jgi:ABC-type branched-subunit amino acid transport system substrate-binding protein